MHCPVVQRVFANLTARAQLNSTMILRRSRATVGAKAVARKTKISMSPKLLAMRLEAFQHSSSWKRSTFL